MYRYDEFDSNFVTSRIKEYSDQVARRLSGQITEDQFKPLRLMNGVYLQLHAYMLRVAIPYGTLNATQMRRLAHIARVYDKGYGHFTTRQNIQYNWPALVDTPKILEELAEVEMHALQTSGNCIRNVTSDQFAGAAIDEVTDPRPWCEILRQWSSIHPEFTYLPRKFKIAVSGSATDRAAVRVHDIGLQIVQNDAGKIGFEVFVGGGLGRTPMIGKLVREFLPAEDLLAYMTAILRVYNLNGRRDNKYKARIKILVHETGTEELRQQIEAQFEELNTGELTLPRADIDAIHAYFEKPDFVEADADISSALTANSALAAWVSQNCSEHQNADYKCVTISLKPIGKAPGDASAEQMELIADLAEKYGHDEIRVSHEQNLVLPHVHKSHLPTIHAALAELDLATANIGLVTDIIACPGLDYCALANARSIPVAQDIAKRFQSPEKQAEIGPLKIKISGCINACGHHHVGHIGILGVEKKGTELFQITLGGSADENTSIGDITGRGFEYDELFDAIERLIDVYLEKRKSPDEIFLEAYRRLGPEPFKIALYGQEKKVA